MIEDEIGLYVERIVEDIGEFAADADIDAGDLALYAATRLIDWAREY